MSNYSDSSFSKDPNSSWYKIFQYIEPESKILDVGCSSGNFGKVLRDKKQCVVDGIELDRADFKLAKDNLRQVFNLNIETDSFSIIKDTYDYIYFGDVIEHLVWPVETLNRIHKLLKPDGQLVFSIPNMAHLLTRLMLLQGDFTYGETGLLDKTHLHFYTVKEVERILEAAGYDLVNFDPVLKDLPEEVIAKELSKVGLKSTKEFIEFARTSEASIYQIVGAARVATNSSKAIKALAPSSPVDLFQKHMNQTSVHYEAQIKAQKEHRLEVEKYAKGIVKDYQKALETIAEKDREIASLKSGVLRRVAKKIRPDTKNE